MCLYRLCLFTYELYINYNEFNLYINFCRNNVKGLVDSRVIHKRLILIMFLKHSTVECKVSLWLCENTFRVSLFGGTLNAFCVRPISLIIPFQHQPSQKEGFLLRPWTVSHGRNMEYATLTQWWWGLG